MRKIMFILFYATIATGCSYCDDEEPDPPTTMNGYGLFVGGTELRAKEPNTGRYVRQIVDHCPADEPEGVVFGIKTTNTYNLVIHSIQAPPGCPVSFAATGTGATLWENRPEDGEWFQEGPGDGTQLIVTIGECDFGEVSFDLELVWTHPDFEYKRGRGEYVDVTIRDSCDHGEPPDEEDPPDGDVPDPIFVFPPIPEEAQTEESVVAVADKEEGACVAVETKNAPDPETLHLLIMKTVTPFFHGVAPSAVSSFIRADDRVQSLLVSDYGPLVTDDAEPPAGVSPAVPRLDLFRVDMPTGKTWRLTRHREEGRSVIAAKWSPSGDRIAYVLRDHVVGGYPVELRVLDVAQGISTLLTDKIHGWGVTWSPDGKTLAFVAGDELWAIDDDGKNERLLFTADDILLNATEIMDIDWHPEDNRIAAVVRGSGSIHGGRIFDLDLDTSGASELAVEIGAMYRFVVWSPSGDKIAFVRTMDTGAQRQLLILDVTSGSPPELVQSTNDYRNLDW